MDIRFDNKPDFEVRCPLCLYMVKIDKDGIVEIIKCPVCGLCFNAATIKEIREVS